MDENDPINRLSAGSENGIINTATGLFSKAIETGLEVIKIRAETGRDVGAVHPTGQVNPDRVNAEQPEIPSVSNVNAKILKYIPALVGGGVVLLVGFFIFTAMKGRR